MHIDCSCIVEMLCDTRLLHTSSPLPLQWYHVCSLKYAVVWVFTPWKLANSSNQGSFPPREPSVPQLVVLPRGPSIGPDDCRLLTRIFSVVALLYFGLWQIRRLRRLKARLLLVLCQSNKGRIPHPVSPSKCLCIKSSPFVVFWILCLKLSESRTAHQVHFRVLRHLPFGGAHLYGKNINEWMNEWK